MKLALFLPVSALAFVLVLGACSSSDKNQPAQTSTPGTSSGWSGKMQELSAALNKLLPLVSSSKEFNDPVNDAAIKESTGKLRQLSHQVRRLEKPAADPAFESIAEMLDEDLARAVTALQHGNRDYARLTIRESIGYCIQCHTQTASGPSFPKLNLGFDPSHLSPLGQGDYYAATRQFDSALSAYRKGVKDPDYAKKDIFGWERAARSALAIAIRFKESPKESKAIATEISKNQAAPESLRKASKSWIKAINAWAKEKPGKYKGDNALLDRADALIQDADKKAEIEDEYAQDIMYLRASSDLHKWLATHPATKEPNESRAKALYLAGRAAEEARELNFWTLHERYYELCIDTLPKSEISKNCYKKLNDSILMGYTGSSGLHLPAEEAARLARLKEKAGVTP